MKKLILPAMMVVLAVTSAFTTDYSADKKAASTLENGWKRLSISNPKLCEESTECQIEFTSTVCRVAQHPSGVQLFRMNGNDECVIPLYKPENK